MNLYEMAEQCNCLLEDNGNLVTDNINLKAFAALVSAAEREACAKLCEDVFTQSQIPFLQGVFTPETCVYAIRARGEKK